LGFKPKWFFRLVFHNFFRKLRNARLTSHSVLQALGRDSALFSFVFCMVRWHSWDEWLLGRCFTSCWDFFTPSHRFSTVKRHNYPTNLREVANCQVEAAANPLRSDQAGHLNLVKRNCLKDCTVFEVSLFTNPILARCPMTL